MLEGVLKDGKVFYIKTAHGSFNPWYVGGGVKSGCRRAPEGREERVSILGMLEGVLKVKGESS